ncbi:2'-5' RNA ligase family protein [Rhodohalobacter sp. SW132]|uniref:2'-5' RNA ligase family protein n=1 Tax=Rhodohalobacter sp. SW132 TaxID=2293433 RepID=UPI000E245AB7|nr:2'-5' RNA ligase family protein [Rhodohalobacter sp. SW132]REL24285.1 2'-5' RNA ligase family protein [Rhodohalobacter sp. SW132]
MPKNLYLIALIPPENLRESVRQLKLEMKEQYNASHALKAPAHITLQMPFRREEDVELHLIETLQKFSSIIEPFEVKINGFDAFPPRVIFLKIVNHEPIVILHSNLNRLLEDKLEFTERELNLEIHPHLTIATRDLTKKMFHKAWPEFRERDFESSFSADRLHLLKHSGKEWEFFKEFDFGKSKR